MDRNDELEPTFEHTLSYGGLLAWRGMICGGLMGVGPWSKSLTLAGSRSRSCEPIWWRTKS